MRIENTSLGRAITALVTGVALLAAAPPTALAEDENIWSQWASEVTDRESKAEVPVAVVTTLPLLVLITPFWLVNVAVDKLTSEDEPDPAGD